MKDYPKDLAALFRPSVQPYLISLLKPDPAKLIAGLEIPVLVVGGAADLQVPPEHGQKLAEANKKAKLVTIEKMSHTLKLVEKPEDQKAAYTDPKRPLAPGLVEALAEFLTKHADRGGGRWRSGRRSCCGSTRRSSRPSSAADDDLRSLNGQIEFLLRKVLADHGRLKAKAEQKKGAEDDSTAPSQFAARRCTLSYVQTAPPAAPSPSSGTPRLRLSAVFALSRRPFWPSRRLRSTGTSGRSWPTTALPATGRTDQGRQGRPG